MTAMTIPAGPTELTAEWLTEALRSGGALDKAAVTSIMTETIGEGSGFIGQLAKVTLTYDQPEPAAPRTLIAKFPGASEGGRMIGNLFDFYHREIRFYDEVAKEVELRTPKRYFSASKRDTQEYILLIEDMDPMLIGDHAGGCKLAEADLAIRQIAKFHAAWWEHPRLEELAEWMPQVDGEVHRSAEPAYAQAWPVFLEMFGKDLSPEFKAIGERIGQNVVKLQSSVSDRPHTIVHGDYRTDNLFFRGPAGGEEFAVVDWQISCRGRGVFDIAYLLCGGLEAEDRRANEERLLKLYHDNLVANGVTGYSFEQCWREYRRMALYVMVYVVIAVGTLDAANERGMALWIAWLRRAVAAVEQLNAIEEMPA
jgi:thiamine kinase-like enzyme